MPVTDDPMMIDDYQGSPDDDEPSDFICIECGDELDSDDVCENEDCELFDAPTHTSYSDFEERQHERKQMGVGG